MSRHSGRILWSRNAHYNFRHNAIAVAAGKIFCMDRMSDMKISFLKRRGHEILQEPVIYALDIRSGRVAWENNADIFGTWLGYSEEHDVLLQAGSASRYRATDEVDRGMVAYRGSDGKVLWQNLELSHGGPCMLHHATIITQPQSSHGQAAVAYDLLTGRERPRRHPMTGREIPWGFIRNYGCNTVVGSEYLLTFRSAAAGFFNLIANYGTGNLGGFKSGCTSNLVPADGVLNAPDYTRTCTCSYQNQTSVAFVHDPTVETWSFSHLTWDGERVTRVGINFGAPGDRMSESGTLWLDYPSVGGPSPDIPVEVQGDTPAYFRRHASSIRGSKLPWVAASGLEGSTEIAISVAKNKDTTQRYTVRLYFAEKAGVGHDQRVFSVKIQGREVIRDLDVAKASGGTTQAIVREFKNIQIGDILTVSLTPKTGTPLICGIELVATG